MKYSEIVVTGIGGDIPSCIPMIRKPDISIEFPPNGQRARKVISRSNAKATGKYPSLKMGRMLHYESSHERNAFRLLDACSEVKSFNEQPCCIRYVMDGVNHIHYPDILVKLPWGAELWEVKTAVDAATLEVTQRTTFMEQALPLLGYRYRVVKAEQLAQLPRLDIAIRLLRSGRPPVSLIQREEIRQIFKIGGNISWGTFKLGAPGGKYYSQICRLILEGTLSVDFNRPLVDISSLHSVLDTDGGATWA